MLGNRKRCQKKNYYFDFFVVYKLWIDYYWRVISHNLCIIKFNPCISKCHLVYLQKSLYEETVRSQKSAFVSFGWQYGYCQPVGSVNFITLDYGGEKYGVVRVNRYYLVWPVIARQTATLSATWDHQWSLHLHVSPNGAWLYGITASPPEIRFGQSNVVHGFSMLMSIRIISLAHMYCFLCHTLQCKHAE